MATWAEVEGRVARHAVVHRDDRSLVCELGTGAEAMRVRAERVRAFDEDWLLVLAAVAPEARAQLRDALTFNMRLALGALALEQGWLVLRAGVPLAGLDDRLIDRHLEFVAGEARRLRSILTLDAVAAAEVFAYVGQ